MKVKIPAESKLFLSKFGAKGFLYPADEFITAPKELFVDQVSYVYAKEYGVIPVRVVVDIGDQALSIKETTIFWVDKSYFGK
jgi:hypothetical protein